MPNHRAKIEIASDEGVVNHISRRFIEVPVNASKGIKCHATFVHELFTCCEKFILLSIVIPRTLTEVLVLAEHH